MTKKTLTFTLALFAGLLGGAFSRYLIATPAQAEATAPKEIRAQKFTLVDQNGTVRGVFAVVDNPVQKGGFPIIELYDFGGREIWSTGPRLEKFADQK